MKNNNLKDKLNIQSKPKVAFVCNHNSCRSQIAEALGHELGSEFFESFSAGTCIKNEINSDAVRLMKQLYNIDMNETQFNKTIFEIPQPDIVIFMGCNVSCPSLSSLYNENWGLDDPSGKSNEEFVYIINQIEQKVLELIEKLK